VDQIAGWVLGQVNPLNWLRAAWGALSGPLYDHVTGLLTSTTGPLSLEGLASSPTVVHYATLTRLIADAALGGILVWAFIGVMWQQSAYGHYRLRMLLPRLLLASVLINFSGPLIQGALDIDRALTMTILHAGGFELKRFFDDIANDLAFGVEPFSLLVALGMLLSLLLLLVVYVLRFALVTVLAITAPLAALLFVLHETSEHARQWSALFVTSVFMQPLQLLIIGIGWSLDTHDFGLGPLRHAFALGCIVLCFRVPGVLHTSALVGRKGFSTGHSLLTHAWKNATKVSHAH
jgi:hypothetical protein